MLEMDIVSCTRKYSSPTWSTSRTCYYDRRDTSVYHTHRNRLDCFVVISTHKREVKSVEFLDCLYNCFTRSLLPDFQSYVTNLPILKESDLTSYQLINLSSVVVETLL